MLQIPQFQSSSCFSFIGIGMFEEMYEFLFWEMMALKRAVVSGSSTAAPHTLCCSTSACLHIEAVDPCWVPSLPSFVLALNSLSVHTHQQINTVKRVPFKCGNVLFNYCGTVPLNLTYCKGFVKWAVQKIQWSSFVALKVCKYAMRIDSLGFTVQCKSKRM